MRATPAAAAAAETPRSLPSRYLSIEDIRSEVAKASVPATDGMGAAEDEPFGSEVARWRGSFCLGAEGMRAKAFDAAGLALDDLDLDA